MKSVRRLLSLGSRRDRRANGRERCAGQASVELALILGTVLIPLTLGIVAILEVLWTYHALATLTRQGARYAATHCFQDDAGTNVTDWMKANAPVFIDRPQLQGGEVQILVNYWAHDFANHESVPFSCIAACTPACVPDAVTVSISNYQFRHLLPLVHLEPLTIPAFSTTVEVQNAGGDPETGASSP